MPGGRLTRYDNVRGVLSTRVIVGMNSEVTHLCSSTRGTSVAMVLIGGGALCARCE